MPPGSAVSSGSTSKPWTVAADPSAGGAGRDLLDPAFLVRLDRLELSARKILSGERRGEQPGRRPGPGTLFRDHRSYVPGDDPRFLDWNAYMRLGDLVVKEFQAEESVRLVLFVDCSGSMGLDPRPKLDLAVRAAAALGYISLRRHASVVCAPLPGTAEPALFRGRASVHRFLDRLAGLRAGGPTEMLPAFQAACPPGRPAGLAVVISDFFETEEYPRALRFLRRRGFSVHVLHLVAREDRAPPDTGVVKLQDVETGRRIRQRLTPALARAYEEAVAHHFRQVAETCRGLQVVYHQAEVTGGLERTVLDLLRSGALVR